jgi:hypothetical protein
MKKKQKEKKEKKKKKKRRLYKKSGKDQSLLAVHSGPGCIKE